MMDISSTVVDQAPTAVKASGVGRDKRATLGGDSTADLFAQALIDNSNHELDWLWAASQLTDVVQRRYCLERALAINANSELARRELRQLIANMPRAEVLMTQLP